jgi:D-alanine-D-alanine ligase
MANYTVGVIFGSRSTEHEVSVVSAMQVIQFLSKRHEVVPIYITKEGGWLTGPKLSRLETYKHFEPDDPNLQAIVITPDTGLKTILNPLSKGIFSKPKPLALDVVFPVIHGAHGEDGTVQGLLELTGLPYVGAGVLASAVGIDKIATKALLKENGLPVLDQVWFTRSDWQADSAALLSRVTDALALPVIVKPASLGSSIGIQKAGSVDDLAYAIDTAIHYDRRILIEPYLANKTEINCSVLGNEDPIASVCEQPQSRDALLSYEDKYLHQERDTGMAGAERLIPAPISEELTGQIQSLAINTFRCLDGAGIARVDMLIDNDTGAVYVNEINTMPGSISFYLWEPSGLPPEQLVDKLLDLALQAHEDKRRIRYSIASSLLQQVDLLGLKK